MLQGGSGGEQCKHELDLVLQCVERALVLDDESVASRCS